MKKLLFPVAAIALLVVVTGCKQDKSDSMKMGDDKSMAAPATTPMVATYTCTMHPEVASDKPGKCPKCGMDLVKK